MNIDASGLSWSYIGTDNLAIHADKHTMNFGWLKDSTSETEFARVITHEFGHALGCIHEHQSPAARIPWNTQAVCDYYKKTNGWSEDDVKQNIFDPYSSSTTQFSSFDPSSIMLYAIPASLTTDGYSTGWEHAAVRDGQVLHREGLPGRGTRRGRLQHHGGTPVGPARNGDGQAAGLPPAVRCPA